MLPVTGEQIAQFVWFSSEGFSFTIGEEAGQRIQSTVGIDERALTASLALPMVGARSLDPVALIAALVPFRGRPSSSLPLLLSVFLHVILLLKQLSRRSLA